MGQATGWFRLGCRLPESRRIDGDYSIWTDFNWAPSPREGREFWRLLPGRYSRQGRIPIQQRPRAASNRTRSSCEEFATQPAPNEKPQVRPFRRPSQRWTASIACGSPISIRRRQLEFQASSSIRASSTQLSAPRPPATSTIRRSAGARPTLRPACNNPRAGSFISAGPATSGRYRPPCAAASTQCAPALRPRLRPI